MPEETVAPVKPDYMWEAEAEKARAEGAKAVAEAEAAAALAEKTRHEATNARHEGTKLELALEKARETRNEELAGHKYHHMYLFDQEVSGQSTKACMKQFTEWERMAAPGEKLVIDLVINSPGGSVFDGFALMDHIELMHSRGHTVNTSVLGMAASMGGVLLQVGKTRTMGKSAMLLIHEASFGASGAFGKVEDQVKLVAKMQDRILDLFAERAKGALGTKAITRQKIKASWRRTDWWVNSTESLKFGFVDKVL